MTVIVTDGHGADSNFSLELNYGDEDEYAIFDYEDSDKFAGVMKPVYTPMSSW